MICGGAKYILAFIEHIYEFSGSLTRVSCIHIVYEMWNIVIENVKAVIYRHKRRRDDETSDISKLVHGILVDR